MADHRLELTVVLERSGDALYASYYDSAMERLLDVSMSVPWASIAPDILYVHEGRELRGLDAITTVLDVGDRIELITYFTQSKLVDVGHALFYTLLGNSDRWEPIIRQLFGELSGPRPNPPRRSVRVRIYTTVPELVDLPWRLSAWKGRFLAESGWTFEVVADIRPGSDVSLDVPAPLLVIAPEFAGMVELGTAQHLEDLRQALPPQYRTPTFFQVVRTRAEARTAFLGMHPRVLYYYGHAEIRGNQTCMLLGDPSGPADAINAQDLRQLMTGNYPQMAYINACKSGAGGWSSVGYQLSLDIPVVIANPTTAWSEHAARSAIAWLESCLAHGRDPVTAAHAVDERMSIRGFEWGMRTIHSSYARWHSRPLASVGPITPIGLRLDRDSSRERVFSRVASMVRDDDHRVMSLITYANRGNRLDLSWQQLRDYLEEHASHFAHVSWREVAFPLERPPSAAELKDELLLSLGRSLGATMDEPLEYTLRRAARGLGVDGATPIIWLNWGVFGQYQAQALSVDELSIWVEAHSELAQICPQDIRVIGYLAYETTQAPHSRLEALVHKLALDYVVDKAFSVELLAPLPDVTLLDLANFLRDKNNTRCPPNLVKDISQLLYTRTHGKYAEVIELIERAEREGWYALLRELRGAGTDANQAESLIL